MSMYTTVMKENGVSFQIKTGMDNCETYVVGDEVPWKVDKNWAGRGHLLDGIYLAEPKDRGHIVPNLYWWVVIRNHRIEAVRLGRTWDAVKSEHPVEPHPREWWTETAWKEHAEREKKTDEDREKFKALYGHLPPMDQIGIASGHFMAAKLREPSLSRQILKPMTLGERMDRETECPRCKGKGTVPDPAWEHKFFDPDQAQAEARMGGARKECPDCKGRGAYDHPGDGGKT